MKLIINTSNLFRGGGIQVAYSFIHECISFTGNEYHIFLCELLIEQIDKSKFPKNFWFYEIPKRPSLFFKGIKIISKLKKLENEIKPDCVFTIFGPSYWTPQAPHLLGYAIPHFLYPESPFFNKIGKLAKFKWSLVKIMKKYFFLKNANFFHVETDDSRKRLSIFLKYPVERIFSVSNTYNSCYDVDNKSPKDLLLPTKLNNEFRFISITAYYPHKNLDILNHVIPLLKKAGLSNIRFVLTMNNDIYDSIFTKESKSQIINIGPVTISNCPQLYKECDAMFLPTLLECFSANYPEAMKMQKPILTSNLPFALEVCNDAALYFDPLDAVDITKKIMRIMTENELRTELIAKGSIQLNSFYNSNERAKQYLRLCEQIIKDCKYV